MKGAALRIFISSPSDVGAERRRAALVVKRLQREFQRFWDVQPVLWESEAMLASGHFQDVIIAPAQTQIFVAIVATRLGTPLPAERYRGIDGRVPVTGTEWEFENALQAAERPPGEPELLIYKKARREIRAADPGEAAAAIAQWQALEAFWERYFGAAGTGFRRGFNTFGDADEFEALLEDHLRQRLRLRLARGGGNGGGAAIVWHQGSPYRGLARFEFEHAEIFHGRTGAQRQVIEQLVHQAGSGTAFVLVVGMSGVGKSSLVRAGVMPDLVAPGVVEGVDGWRRVIVRPRDGPEDLVQALAAALVSHPDALPEVAQAGTDAPTLGIQLGGDAAHAGLALRAGLQLAARGEAARLGKPAARVRVVLLVDQLEELFSLETITPAQRQAFAAVVAGLARDGAVWVLGTIRSDFYQRLAEVPALLELARGEGLFHLTPPTLGELRALIEQPAAAAGVTFERNEAGRALSDEVLAAAADEAGGLPLLEFALNELYERDVIDGGGTMLTFASYTASGQLEGAIAARADDARAALAARGPAYAAALESLLLRLVTVREDDDVVTGRSITVEQPRAGATAGPIGTVIDELVGRRLLVASGEGGRARVELAHEALIKHWPYMRALMARERGFLRTRVRVARDAKEWIAAGSPTDRADLLLRDGKPLADAEDLLAHRRSELREEMDGQLIAFIDASQSAARQRRQAAELEAERRARRARAVAGAFAVFTLVALAVAALAYWQWQTATTQAARALAGRLVSTARDEARGQPEIQLLLSAQALSCFEGPEAANALLSALLTTGGLRATLGSPNAVLSVAFSPDGQTLAAVAGTGVQLWDVATRQPLGEPLGDGGSSRDDLIWSIAISPDGSILAVAREDQTIRLWDLATRQPLGEPLRGHQGRVLSVTFSPDGNTLASASSDGTVRLWEVSTSQPLGEPLRGTAKPVSSVAFSPDGRTLAFDNDTAVQLWDVATRQPLGGPLRGHEADVVGVTFSPDGSTLASASTDKTVRLWDVATHQPLGEALRGHEGVVWKLAFSPDGRTLASGGDDKTIRLWDVAARAPLGEPLRGHQDTVLSVAFSPRGRILASGSLDQTIRLWDTTPPQPLSQTIGVHDDEVISVAFSPDGRILASGSADQTARLWEVATHRLMGEPLRGHESPVDSVAFSPDGRTVASGGDDKTIRLFDVATHQPVGEPLRGHEDEVWSVAFSPDGSTLASGSKDKTIRLWNVATGLPLGQPLRGHEGPVVSVAISPDGRIVASGSRDKTVRLWEMATRQPLGEPLHGHDDEVWQVAFSADGRSLASVGDDKAIRLWDVATRQPLGEPLRGHTLSVRSVAFSPDGRTLASAGGDKTIRLWDTTTRQPFDAPLPGHEDDVQSLAFSRDGRMLASGSKDKTVRLWDVHWQSWRRRACALANRNLTCEEWRLYVADIPYQKTCDDLPGPAPACAAD